MPNMGINKKPAVVKPARKPKPAATLAPKVTAKKVTVRESRAAYRVDPRADSINTPFAGSGLADALFTTTQQRVLALFFGRADRSFFANEIINLTGSGSGAVQRELARLEATGLVTAHWIGNQKHYQANAASPIFSELLGIVQKTVGLAEPLRIALLPLTSQIRAAFVYGSIANSQDSTASDIDVMVISDDLAYADLFAALEPITITLGRAVNPTVLSQKEVAKRVKAGNAFIQRVMAQPKIWLIGSEHDLGV